MAAPNFYRPSGAFYFYIGFVPRADALGYILPPLRGCPSLISSHFLASTTGASSLARTRPKKERTSAYFSAGMVETRWTNLRV